MRRHRGLRGAMRTQNLRDERNPFPWRFSEEMDRCTAEEELVFEAEILAVRMGVVDAHVTSSLASLACLACLACLAAPRSCLTYHVVFSDLLTCPQRMSTTWKGVPREAVIVLNTARHYRSSVSRRRTHRTGTQSKSALNLRQQNGVGPGLAQDVREGGAGVGGR